MIDGAGARWADSFDLDGVAAVERAAERVDGATEQAASHRHANNLAGALDQVAGFDRIGIVEQHAAE